MRDSGILYLLNLMDIWSFGKKDHNGKILLLLNDHPFVLWGDDDWYFYRAYQWCSLRSAFQLEASLCLKQNWGKMTKKEKKFVVQSWFNTQTHTLTTLLHLIYLWLFFWRTQDTRRHSQVMTPPEASTLLYLCIKFSTFPSTCFSTQTSKSTWKGRDINSNPTPSPPLYREQCGSYYLISIPYSQRYFNDPRLVLSWSWS